MCPVASAPKRLSAIALAAAAVLAACTGSASDSAASIATTTTAPSQPRVDDGVLRLGALIPINDPTVGATLLASFEAAVQALNDAGGVLGQSVEFLVGDEGSSPATAAAAAEQLVTEGVDAIVGPTSSNNAIAALDETVAAGIVACSATATGISLDDFPDDGLFFRSIASDSLQARAIANLARTGGASRVAILHIDDAYGRPYANAVTDAIAARSTSVDVVSVAVTVGDDDLSDELSAFAAAEVGIVLGNGDSIARFLESIGQRDDIDVDPIIVNDAARSASSRPVIAALDPELRTRIIGVTPRILLPESISADDAPFASQVTDCVNLIALSAVQGGTDDPEVIASQMSSVSAGGETCRSFEECVELLEGDNQINYDGPTRITVLARDGGTSRAFFDQFGFQADGSDVLDAGFAVG